MFSLATEEEKEKKTNEQVTVPVEIIIPQILAILQFDDKIKEQILFSFHSFLKESSKNDIEILIQNDIPNVIFELFHTEKKIYILSYIAKIIRTWIIKYGSLPQQWQSQDILFSLFYFAVDSRTDIQFREYSFKALILLLCNFSEIVSLLNEFQFYEALTKCFMIESNPISKSYILRIIFLLFSEETLEYNLNDIRIVGEILKTIPESTSAAYHDELCIVAHAFCSLGADFYRYFFQIINIPVLFSTIADSDSSSQESLILLFCFFLSTNDFEIFDLIFGTFSWEFVLPIFEVDNKIVKKALFKLVLKLFEIRPSLVELDGGSDAIDFACICFCTENYEGKEAALMAFQPLLLSHQNDVVVKLVDNNFIEDASAFLQSPNQTLCCKLIGMFLVIASFAVYHGNEEIMMKMEENGIFDTINEMAESAENEDIQAEANKFINDPSVTQIFDILHNKE